jgi:V8-like Glu-specific endopeptidase
MLGCGELDEGAAPRQGAAGTEDAATSSELGETSGGSDALLVDGEKVGDGDESEDPGDLPKDEGAPPAGTYPLEYDAETGLPLVPKLLSEDPRDPRFLFEGWAHEPRRKRTAEELASDEVHDWLSEHATAEELDAWERAYVEDWKLRMVEERKAKGLPWDLRETESIVVDDDSGTVWRIQKDEPAPKLTKDQLALAKAVTTRAKDALAHQKLAANTDETKEICGGDDRTLVSRHNGYTMTITPHEEIGALQKWCNGHEGCHYSIPDEDEPSPGVVLTTRCTATKVSPRLVLTAGHCLAPNSGGGRSWNHNRRWMPGADGVDGVMNGRDPTPNVSRHSQWRYVTSQWWDYGWYSYDLGVMVLYDDTAEQNQLNCGIKWFGVYDDEYLLSDTVRIRGYPASENYLSVINDCAASPISHGECGGSQYLGIGEIIRTTVHQISYVIDTQEGTSGAPIYKTGGTQHDIVGVNSWSNTTSYCESTGVRMRQSKIDWMNSIKTSNPATPACP